MNAKFSVIVLVLLGVGATNAAAQQDEAATCIVTCASVSLVPAPQQPAAPIEIEQTDTTWSLFCSIVAASWGHLLFGLAALGVVWLLMGIDPLALIAEAME